MNRKATLCALFIVLVASRFAAAESVKPSDVAAVFAQYESLNSAYLLSVGSPSEARLRAEVEKYAEGPLESALASAVELVCRTGNAETLRALFHVIVATQNSASESPAWSLGRVFVCRADLVEAEFAALPATQRRSLYEMMNFGFENVVYGHSKELDVAALRARLHSLGVAGKK